MLMMYKRKGGSQKNDWSTYWDNSIFERKNPMALVKCRECGKEVSSEAALCPYCGVKEPAPLPKKGNRFWIVAGVAVLVGAALIFIPRMLNKQPAKPEPHYQRDEPTQQQIYQPDKDQKIKEMLDSGQSVREISNETGIKKTEIKKIKKQHQDETKKTTKP